MASIFSQIGSPQKSLRHHIVEALTKLTVDQGIPPASDSWVFSNIVEPALSSQGGPNWDNPLASENQETFLEGFKKVALSIAERLKEQPVIVAHSENTFDGAGIKRLLSNKFESDKTLNSVVENLPKDKNGKISKEYLRLALDGVSPSAGLPPFGAIDEMDKVIGEVFKMMNADDAKLVKEDEFKKLMTCQNLYAVGIFYEYGDLENAMEDGRVISHQSQPLVWAC
ncbi:hypothetical protein PIB30_028362 [Stylosanthes scabra]|uniref:EF-hand domain-containing protein n=1 Tax=Stylosanthes scabra TaxID=79078 RepID=A0ABU6RBS1_9FABA|nr:hypothetical protein [Stylosanthes scabra]